MDTDQIFEMIINFDNEKLAEILHDSLDYEVRDRKTGKKASEWAANPDVFQHATEKFRIKLKFCFYSIKHGIIIK